MLDSDAILIFRCFSTLSLTPPFFHCSKKKHWISSLSPLAPDTFAPKMLWLKIRTRKRVLSFCVSKLKVQEILDSWNFGWKFCVQKNFKWRKELRGAIKKKKEWKNLGKIPSWGMNFSTSRTSRKRTSDYQATQSVQPSWGWTERGKNHIGKKIAMEHSLFIWHNQNVWKSLNIVSIFQNWI